MSDKFKQAALGAYNHLTNVIDDLHVLTNDVNDDQTASEKLLFNRMCKDLYKVNKLIIAIECGVDEEDYEDEDDE